MAASGMTLDDDARSALDNIAGTNPEKTWLIFEIKDNMIKISEGGTEEDPFTVVVEKLKSRAEQCAYVVLNHAINEEEKKMVKDESKPSKFLVYLSWIDDNVGIKKKMVYAASRAAILGIISDKIKGDASCNDDSDLTRPNMLDVIKKKNPRLF